MESVHSETPPEETNQEFRIQVTSKTKVTDQINRYKEVLKSVLDEQEEISQETRSVLLQELLANFEAAVQTNVLVNGQTWDEAPDVEEHEAIDLESVLDDTIVETSSKRRSYPKKILPHVVHTLKAERKIMGLYEQVVKPEDTTKDPRQGF